MSSEWLGVQGSRVLDLRKEDEGRITVSGSWDADAAMAPMVVPDGTHRVDALVVKQLSEQESKNKEANKGLLDGFVMLEASNVELPDQATSVNLNNRGLYRVVEEDLKFFKRVSFADFGENQLSIADLSSLASVEELRLQCNGIVDIPGWKTVSPFPALVILDLSYNKLSPEAFSMLARLRRLRELDLTCNELEAVPTNMDEFSNLEVLLLGQNSLSNPESMTALSQAPHLRELDLSDNGFDVIPDDILFERLEWLSLVNNQIAHHADVEALIACPELTQVLLYGNPLTERKLSTNRPSGKNQSASIIFPKSFPGSSVAQPSKNWGSEDVINVVTNSVEDGGVRQTRTKRGMYSHFKIIKVHDVEVRKPSEWKALGNELKMKSLVKHEAKQEEAADTEAKEEEEEVDSGVSSEEDDDDDVAAIKPKFAQESKSDLEPLTMQPIPKQARREEHKAAAGKSIFLTEPSLFDDAASPVNDPHSSEGDRESPPVANRKQEKQQSKQQKPIKPESLTSIAALRHQLAQCALPDDDEEEAAEYSKGRSKSKKRDPAVLRNAMVSLRHALRHPLTSHKVDAEDEFQQGGMLDQDSEDEDLNDEAALRKICEKISSDKKWVAGVHRFERVTEASKSKVRQKIPFSGYARQQELMKERTKAKGKRVPGSPLSPESADGASNQLFDGIEKLLDKMKDRSELQQLSISSGALRDENGNAVDGLLNLVNQVMDSFEP